ncbi:MAG: rod shape-determining protein MreC [Patescibacteria group bacterium]
MKRKGLNFLINRQTVVSLLVLLFLIIGHYSGLLNPLESRIFSVARPFNNWLYRQSSDINKNNRDLEVDLATCQNKISNLAVDSAKVSELQDENNKLRAFINFFSNHEYRKIYADVLAQELLSEKNETRQNIIIDKGFKDGVLVGLGVIDESGVIVGKVVESKDRSAKICLVTSSSCKLAATIQNKEKTIGVSEGSLGLTTKMNFIPQTEKINLNDLVITSGLGEIIPRGLVIGRVSEVINKSNEIWQSATIEPLVDLNNLTIVSVVLP